MSIEVVLVDVNTNLVEAWRAAFFGQANVRVVSGSILAQKVDAWVTPTNAKGQMSGGVDAAIRGRLGAAIEQRVQKAIAAQHGGAMPVGYATCVPTGLARPAWLISTPTMQSASEPIRDTLHVALACCAAFQAVALHNEKHPSPIASLALPGLGTGTGRVPVEACAELMWLAYRLFGERYFDDFASIRSTLEIELAAVDPSSNGRDAARRLREAMFARAGLPGEGGPGSPKA